MGCEPVTLTLAMGGCHGLDREIWTKSGPSLDCAWTVFSKMVAEITMACKVKVRKKVT